MTRSITFVILLIIYQNIFSQFTINAELRSRYEFRDGYKSLPTANTSPVNIISQRSKINFDSKSEKLHFSLSVQDVRVWGEVPVNKDIPSSFFNEAFGELFFKESLSFKIGRQKLNYDDERLLSVTNWNNIGTSHDVALLKTEKDNFKAHFGVAYNNEKEKNFESFYPEKYYKALYFVWVENRFNENYTCSFINILDGNQKDSSDHIIFYRNTMGSNFNFTLIEKGIKLTVNFYYQLGKDVTGKNIRAFFYSINTNKEINEKLKILAAFECYSGQDGLDTTNTTINTFNKLYGAGHKFAGGMDYFVNTYTQTKKGGLMDLYLGTNYKLKENWSFSVFAHYLSLANNVVDPNFPGPGLKAINKNLGTEIDLLLRHSFTKEVKIDFGYSVMFAQKSMEVIKGGDSNQYPHWAYIMVNIRPKLL